ncbi:FxsA family protein [Oceaniglobus indicus]|uniref:FxsA family protein n=1 Tax=Oceaniglobus indicus TaxID=2047749 RepID=UPI000C17B71B|nr:FxsA family protein [Oceaniglobus indicus]
MWLFLAFLVVPIVEIALFIQAGELIGLWPTLGIVILTAVLGTAMVRAQGALAMGQIRQSFNQMSDPSEALAHGAMILVAGVLLLTPGFFTDAVGFALLLPPVRMAAFRFLRKRITVTTFQAGPSGMRHDTTRPDPHGGDVIDGEFHEVDPPRKPTHGPSGWTRH